MQIIRESNEIHAVIGTLSKSCLLRQIWELLEDVNCFVLQQHKCFIKLYNINKIYNINNKINTLSKCHNVKEQ